MADGRLPIKGATTDVVQSIGWAGSSMSGGRGATPLEVDDSWTVPEGSTSERSSVTSGDVERGDRPRTRPDVPANRHAPAAGPVRIIDAFDAAVIVLDRPVDGRILGLNRTALAWLGRAPDELIGQSMSEVLVGTVEDTAAAPPPTAPVAAEADAEVRAMHLRTGRGPDRAVEVRFARVDGSSGEAWLAIMRDPAELGDTASRLRMLAEAEHARAAELNAVIRAMGDGLIVCGADGRITLTNPAGRDLFPDVTERTYADILAQLDDPDHLAPALGRHAGPVALRARYTPGRWIEVTTYPVDVRREDGATGPETIVVLRDVTAARQRESVRETFIGVLSHELRTPVTTIYGGAKTLARPDTTLDEATRREIFVDIAAEAERLQRLVEDVVALNRFGEDDGELGQEPVLLQRIVPGVVRSEEGRWPGVRFEATVPLGLPTVVADPTYVEQIVRNLLSNAAKYSGSDATVEVVLEAAEDEVLVRILDDGPGIEPERGGSAIRALLPLGVHLADDVGCRDRALRVRPSGGRDGWPDLGPATTGRGRRVRVLAPAHAGGLRGLAPHRRPTASDASARPRAGRPRTRPSPR